MNRIAKKNSWQNFPIDHPKRIDIDLQFTDDQFTKLKKGLIPEEMEDKWFIYFENEWLYFHRSWTGIGIYKAHIKKVKQTYCIKEFWAERNQEKYKVEDDHTDIENFQFLIARGLLEIDFKHFNSQPNIKSETNPIEEWSQLGNLLFMNQEIDYADKIKSVLFGVAIGDALGVPVEFVDRYSISMQPVTDMVGQGTYNLPAGTWSDDSSLTFCLAEALTKNFDLNTIGQNFVNWYKHNYWTARGNLFDIGIATREAIERLAIGEQPDLAGGVDINSNGNGSLMRISPLLFYLIDKPIHERFEITRQVSSITHRHVRSVIACFYYLEFSLQLFKGVNKFEIYENLQTIITAHLNSISISSTEITVFDRLLKEKIYEYSADTILSSGYVLHTLEASIWCLLTTDNYKQAVLKAVNLGDDSDTTGAVTGGLAGLCYGLGNIPADWLLQVARNEDIEDLAERLSTKLAIL